MTTFPVPAPRGWSAKPEPGLEAFDRDTFNWNTAGGYPRTDKGYKILQQLDPTAAIFLKGGASWLHKHTDGTGYPIYWYDGELFWEDSGAATSLVSGLGDLFLPTFVPFSDPGGVSAVFFGDNTKAKILRKNGAVIEDVALDMDVIAGSITVSSTPTTGGNLSNGTYYITVIQIDNVGARSVLSGPFATITQILSGGTSTQRIILDLTSATYAARAVNYRVFLSTTADSPDSFFQNGVDTIKSTTTFTISNTTIGIALAHRNNFVQVSKLPITAVRYAVIWQGRLVFAADRNTIGWSERDDINHYLSTNVVPVEEGDSNSPITGLFATADALYIFTADSIHMLTGDFSRDEDFLPRVKFRTIETALGCASHGSIFGVPFGGVAFWSQFGPCTIVGATVQRLLHDDVEDFIPFIDSDFAERITGDFDPDLRALCWAVPRVANTNWPDPASGQTNAGICDWWIRYNLDEHTFSLPRYCEVTHLHRRLHPATEGTKSAREYLTAVGPHGSVLQMNYGAAQGPTGDISGAPYDSLLASSEPTTTSAIIAAAGIAANDWQGFKVSIRYHSGDTNFPNVIFQRVIKSNTATSGGNVTINWDGAVTLSTGTKWTIRIGGFVKRWLISGLAFGENPRAQTRLDRFTVLHRDVVGHRSRS